MKKIAVFDYSSGEIIGLDLRGDYEDEGIIEAIISEKLNINNSSFYWMEVENFNIRLLS